MKNIIITTNVKTTDLLMEKAKKIADQLRINFVYRKKKTIKQLLENYDGIIVVYKNKISYFENDIELFFHLDTTALKLKNNDNEPLIALINEKNQKILDCTMGLASDSLLLSCYGHCVTALEKNPIIHLIVSEGLKTYETSNKTINEAMKNITTWNIDSLNFLKNSQENSFDIIYFDPMFSHNIEESKNLAGIEMLAEQNFPLEQFLKEAKRVARKKIIIKAHFKDTIFEDYNFIRIIRKNTKFHYGYINIKK